jgi:hypothetical protein
VRWLDHTGALAVAWEGGALGVWESPNVVGQWEAQLLGPEATLPGFAHHSAGGDGAQQPRIPKEVRTHTKP